ncbi:AraC family transcriptional regulator [Paenibacillus yanchengensis]|uniref:AraC family transcriptional regulator n=1 Tax=Paenibacillus yanchengensis TaxID=2035833 RepID=A0ABW4YFT4_9BACL
MRKSWFARLLVSYMPVFILVITFLFFILFHMFGEQSKQEAAQSNKVLLQQAMQMIDTSLKAIDTTVLREISKSEELRSFFTNATNFSSYLSIRAVNKMNEMINYNSLIDSIYLVRYEDDFVLSNGVQAKSEQFADHNYIKQIKEQNLTKWTDRRLFRHFEHLTEKPVLSLVRQVHDTSGVTGVIVVNVATSSISRMTEGLFSPDISFLQVRDRQQQVLFHNSSEEMENKAVQATLVSPYSGWSYESGFVRDDLLRRISLLNNIWFYVGVIMIVFGLIWIIIVTRRHSKPIEKIVHQFSSYALPSTMNLTNDKQKMDEFSFISKTLDDIMKQSMQYQKQYKESKHLRMQHLFHQLLEGEAVISNDEWLKEVERMQLPEPKGLYYRVAIIEVDKYGEFCSQYTRNDQNLLKFAVRTVANELLPTHQFSFWTEWIAAAQLAIITFEDDQEKSELKLYAAADQMRLWIEQYLKITVTIAVGEQVSSKYEISQSQRSAEKMLKYKYALGENRIIGSEDLLSVGQAEVFSLLHETRELIQLIRKADSSWTISFEHLFKKLQEGMMSNDEIALLLDYLAYQLDRECSSLHRDLLEIWSETTEPALHNLLENDYTLQDLQKEMLLLLYPFVEQIKEFMKSGQHGETIREMTAFIKREFHNPNMSLEYLSEQFNIQPKYVSKLYKDTTGQKFVDFLIEVRVAEAKKLLEETDFAIQDIAEKVGYTSAISFGRVFKRVVGTSPSEYRAKIEE